MPRSASVVSAGYSCKRITEVLCHGAHPAEGNTRFLRIQFAPSMLPFQPVASVHDLGVQLDCDVPMASHVCLVSSSCYAALWQIRSVKSALPRHALLTLVQALVVSGIDYCNSMLHGWNPCSSSESPACCHQQCDARHSTPYLTSHCSVY